MVDDFLQFAVWIIADEAAMIEHHQFAVLSRIGLPVRQSVDVRIAVVGKLCPGAAHQVGQFQVFCRRIRQIVLGAMEGIEAELQFMTVDGAVVQGRSPGEHIHIGGSLTAFGDGISRDDGLRAEEPVDAQQVLVREIGIGLGKGIDVCVCFVAKGGLERFLGLAQGHLLILVQALQFVEGGVDHLFVLFLSRCCRNGQ